MEAVTLNVELHNPFPTCCFLKNAPSVMCVPLELYTYLPMSHMHLHVIGGFSNPVPFFICILKLISILVKHGQVGSCLCSNSCFSESHRSNSKISKQKGSSEGNGPLLGDIHQNELTLYLSACKFLDTALSFPPDKMQLFQM